MESDLTQRTFLVEPSDILEQPLTGWDKRIAADLTAEMPLQTWATFIAAAPDERESMLSDMALAGPREQVDSFVRVLGRQS